MATQYTQAFEGNRIKYSNHRSVPRRYFLEHVQMEKLGTRYYYVYALLNSEGEYLYIGHTCDLDLRMNQHKSSKYWWGQVCKIEYEVVPYMQNVDGRVVGPCPKKTARERECELIKNYQPKYNGTLRKPKELDLPPMEQKYYI